MRQAHRFAALCSCCLLLGLPNDEASERTAGPNTGLAAPSALARMFKLTRHILRATLRGRARPAHQLSLPLHLLRDFLPFRKLLREHVRHKLNVGVELANKITRGIPFSNDRLCARR